MARLPINHQMLLCLGLVFLLVIQASAVSYGIDEAKAADVSSELLSINGTVFNDLNANRFMDEGEPGLPGWTVRLMQDDTEVSNTTSDDSGRYIFEGLNPGRYVVAQDLMPGWNQTAPGGEIYNITLVDRDGHRYDFGNFEGEVLALDAVEYPLMRPTIEELQRWIEAYKTAPLAWIDPEIEKMLEISPTGSRNLLNYLQYTPLERDQGVCGNCWAWAGTGVMEIALAVQDGVKDRFSIQYINSNYNGGNGPTWACCGGNLGGLAGYYAATGKSIPWSNANAHWQDGGRSCASGSTSVPAGTISTSPSYPITSITAQTVYQQGAGSAAAIAAIKNALHQDKAVFFGYYLPTNDEWNSFFSFWGNQPETAIWDPTFPDGKVWINGQGGGHAVLCVGYNDDDPNNKYWIMLNSWGTTAGRPNGLFRVDMNMNYDNYFSINGYELPAFSWSTLDLDYDLEHPPTGWFGLGGYSTSLPNMIVDDQGRTHIFVRGGDGALWDNIDGVWYRLGGGISSAPFPVKDNYGRIHVLARGDDSALWDLRFDTGAWSASWYYMGGCIAEMPTATQYWGTGSIVIMTRACDDTLWALDLVDPAGMSGYWIGLGGIIRGVPYVMEDTNGKIHTLSRGGDNALWDHVIDSPGSFNWYYLGGGLSTGQVMPTAVNQPGRPGHVSVMVRAPDNALWMCDLWLDMSPHWYRLGGVIGSGGYAVTDSLGRIHTFAKGADGAAWENVFSSSPWNPSGAQWHYQGGVLHSMAWHPVAFTNGYTQMALVGSDSALYKKVYPTMAPLVAPTEEDERTRIEPEPSQPKDIRIAGEMSEVAFSTGIPVEIVPLEDEVATMMMMMMSVRSIATGMTADGSETVIGI